MCSIMQFLYTLKLNKSHQMDFDLIRSYYLWQNVFMDISYM